MFFILINHYKPNLKTYKKYLRINCNTFLTFDIKSRYNANNFKLPLTTTIPYAMI